jgi:hypothetical protein
MTRQVPMTRQVLAASVVAALVMSGPAHGQDQRLPGEHGDQRAVQQERDLREGLVSIEFPGGTLAGYVRMVEQAAPTGINIIVTGPADEVHVHGVTLKGVEVRTALDVAVALHPRPIGAPGYSVRLLTPGTGRPAPVYLVEVEERTWARPRPPRLETAVISLRELLDARMKAETILTAVETALQADPEADEPLLRFHEPSSLLIVRAPAAQTAVVRQVIEELSKSAAAMRAEAELAGVREAIAGLQEELAGVQQAHAAASEKQSTTLEALSRQADRGEPEASRQLLDLQREYAAARSAFETARRRERELRDRMDELMQRERSLQAATRPDRVAAFEAENARLKQEVAALRAQLVEENRDER